MAGNDRERYALGAIVLALVTVISDYYIYNLIVGTSLYIIMAISLIVGNILSAVTIYNLLKLAWKK